MSTTTTTPTTLPTKCNPLAPQLTETVHTYLDKTWSFSSANYKSAFFEMDFPRLLALFCPEGPLDRLESAALFVCLTGILDGTLIPDTTLHSPALWNKCLVTMYCIDKHT